MSTHCVSCSPSASSPPLFILSACSLLLFGSQMKRRTKKRTKTRCA